MKNKDFYKWPEESFEDKVKREMAMPVWDRPSMMDDCRPVLFCSFGRRYSGQRISI